MACVSTVRQVVMLTSTRVKTIIEIAEALNITEAQVFHASELLSSIIEDEILTSDRSRKNWPMADSPGLEALFIRLYLDRHIMSRLGDGFARPRLRRLKDRRSRQRHCHR